MCGGGHCFKGRGYGGYGHCFMKGGSINDNFTLQQQITHQQAFINPTMNFINLRNLQRAINAFTNGLEERQILLDLFQLFLTDYLRWLNLTPQQRQNYNTYNIYTSYRPITDQSIMNDVRTYIINEQVFNPPFFTEQELTNIYHFSIGYFRIMTEEVNENSPYFNDTLQIPIIRANDFDEDDPFNLLPLMSVRANVINFQDAINRGRAMDANPVFIGDMFPDDDNEPPAMLVDDIPTSTPIEVGSN